METRSIQGESNFLPKWLSLFGVQALILTMLTFLFYGNTISNENALDDALVIERNAFVHRGLAGIPDILTHDTYFCYYDQLGTSNQLQGGRYRPLSVVTYAIEQQFMGVVPAEGVDSIITYGLGFQAEYPFEKKFISEMHTRHLFNVVWYALAAIAVLAFLRVVVFRGSPMVALVAAVLFVIHPAHTEVVANVKSRDEILSMLFIVLALLFAVWYNRRRGIKLLATSIVCFALALLSKEYAITLLVILPLTLFVFEKVDVRKAALTTLPFLVVAIGYGVWRLHVLGPRSPLSDTDIQINPYAYASAAQKLATEISTSLRYLKLLVWPHPLSSDYSYAQIPYTDFADPVVWLSLLVHISLAVGVVVFAIRRHLLAFALSFYLLNLLLVNNFLFDIGATMGERLIFHSSLGFVIAVAWGAAVVVRRYNVSSGFVAALLPLVTLAAGYKTTARNRDWKNNGTLFLKDIEASPNSFLVNLNVATILCNRTDYEPDSARRRADLERAIPLFDKVIGMQENFVLGYMNRAIAYLKLGVPDKMEADLDAVRRIYPIYPQLLPMYYRAAQLYLAKQNAGSAKRVVQKGLQLNPNDIDFKRLGSALDSTNVNVDSLRIIPK
ncbi:MAG: hypothetical protein IAE95_13285 [Chitinophagaceae bacterium]|nr:hypothetical protein [Chitinophagaceae bacterium]